MYVNCVLERLQIMQCPKHELARLADTTGETFDKQAAYDTLAIGQDLLIDSWTMKNGPALAPPIHPWCSLCAEPTFQVCSCSKRWSSPAVGRLRQVGLWIDALQLLRYSLQSPWKCRGSSCPEPH